MKNFIKIYKLAKLLEREYGGNLYDHLYVHLSLYLEIKYKENHQIYNKIIK